MQNKLYMTADQVKALMEDNAIGSHGHVHMPMGFQDITWLQNDFKMSNAWFSKMGYRPTAISYPYGSFESLPFSSNFFELADYEYGFSMERAANNFPFTNRHFLARVDCNDLPVGKAPIISENDLKSRKIKLAEWFL